MPWIVGSATGLALQPLALQVEGIALLLLLPVLAALAVLPGLWAARWIHGEALVSPPARQSILLQGAVPAALVSVVLVVRALCWPSLEGAVSEGGGPPGCSPTVSPPPASPPAPGPSVLSRPAIIAPRVNAPRPGLTPARTTPARTMPARTMPADSVSVARLEETASGAREPEYAPSSWIAGISYRIEARVDEVSGTARGGLRLLVTVLQSAPAYCLGSGPSPPGRVALSIRGREGDWQAGDRIAFRSRLRPPANFGNPGELDWVAWYRRRGLAAGAYVWNAWEVEKLPAPGSLLQRFIRRFRGEFVRTAQAYGAGGRFSAALVAGDRTSLEPSEREILARAGLAHLLAISGLHFGLVAGGAYAFVFGVLRRVVPLAVRVDVRRGAALASLLAAVGYRLVAGGGVSVVRALAMTMVSLALVWHGGRVRGAWSALGLAAAVVGLWMPGALGEVGFRLSFVAVAALLAWGPGLQAALGRVPRGVTLPVGLFLTSLVCFLATAPVLARSFHRMTPVAPLSNLLVSVPVTLVLGSGLAGALLRPVWPLAADVLTGISARTGDGIFAVASVTSSAAWSDFPVVEPGWGLTFSLIGLVFLPAVAPPRRRMIAGVLVSLGVVSALWSVSARFPPDRADLWALSVGQGDATVLRLPGGRVVLVDAGLPGRGRMVVLPFLRRQAIATVDVLVVTHLDADHAGGVAEVLEGTRVHELWRPAGRCEAELWSRIEAVAADRGTRVVEVGTGGRSLDGRPPDGVPAGEGRSRAGRAEAPCGVRVSREALPWPVHGCFSGRDQTTDSDLIHQIRIPSKYLEKQIESSGFYCSFGVFSRLVPWFRDRRAGPAFTLRAVSAAVEGGCEPNDRSVVLRLDYAGRSVLLAGDVESPAERWLVGHPLTAEPVDVLKVPHHASATSSTAAFLARTGPGLALASLGRWNRYGFPAPEVLARYSAAGVPVLRTDVHGAIHIQIRADGSIDTRSFGRIRFRGKGQFADHDGPDWHDPRLPG